VPKKNAAPVEPTPITGYRPRPRFRTVTMDAIDVEDGAEPFTAKIRAHLTFGEVEEIGYRPGVKFVDLEPAIAPYVVGWNVLGRNKETGDMEPVPPPAEAGVDAFKMVGGFEVEWLAIELSKTHLGLSEDEAERKKSSPPSGSTPEPNSDASSA
jgi:hypothetical protein